LISFDLGHPAEGARMLPEEVAVALSYNGSTQAVMMATPADLEDFGYGFSLTERIAAPDEIESLEIVETGLGLDLQIWLRPEAEGRLARRRRTMAGPVGCGLCGIDSLEEATRKLRPVAETGMVLSSAQVLAAVASLPRHQPLQDVTRAVHAAAFWSVDRGLAVLREDVGRHNALDKLAGALLRDAINPGLGAVIITSRVSIDMVQKTAALGVPMLVAVSAPTTAAVAQAEASGITLVALARQNRFEVYSRSDRIYPDEATHVA
jgi:FdhD protein